MKTFDLRIFFLSLYISSLTSVNLFAAETLKKRSLEWKQILTLPPFQRFKVLFMVHYTQTNSYGKDDGSAERQCSVQVSLMCSKVAIVVHEIIYQSNDGKGIYYYAPSLLY